MKLYANWRSIKIPCITYSFTNLNKQQKLCIVQPLHPLHNNLQPFCLARVQSIAVWGFLRMPTNAIPWESPPSLCESSIASWMMNNCICRLHNDFETQKYNHLVYKAIVQDVPFAYILNSWSFSITHITSIYSSNIKIKFKSQSSHNIDDEIVIIYWFPCTLKW